MAKVRVSIVPGYKLGSCSTAFKFNAGDIQIAIRLRAGCIYDLMIVLSQIGDLDVLAKLYVAKEPEAGICSNAIIDFCY